MVNSERYEIKNMHPKDLIPWERNPRRHNLPALKASIERFGFRNVIVVNSRTNTIEAGHGRAQVALELGITSVPVLFVDDDDDTAKAYAIADNRQAEIGGWDEEALVPLLRELQELGDTAIAGLGYSDAEIATLIRRIEPTENTIFGMDAETSLEVFEEGLIKQIILYYAPDQYTDLMLRMKKIMEENALGSNSQLLAFLVADYESRNYAITTS